MNKLNKTIPWYTIPIQNSYEYLNMHSNMYVRNVIVETTDENSLNRQ